MINPEGVGKRVKLKIGGEDYYLIGTRADDNGLDFTVTCPDENKATGIQRRITAEKICAECSALSRVI